MDPIDVRLEVDGPRPSRHRLSVWDDDGALLSAPSAELPIHLCVPDGDTIWVEASVPGVVLRNGRAARDERRWELRAASDAHAVLNLGRKGTSGGAGTRIAIRVDGAAQQRKPRAGVDGRD